MAPSDRASGSHRGPVGLNGRVLFALLLFLGAAYFLVAAWGFEGEAREVPLVVGIPTTILAAASLLQELRRTGDPEDTSEAGAEVGGGTTVARAIAWLLGLVVLFYVVGWPFTLPLFLATFLRVYGREPWTLVIGVTAATWVVLHLLFVALLKVQMYEGIVAG